MLGRIICKRPAILRVRNSSLSAVLLSLRTGEQSNSYTEPRCFTNLREQESVHVYTWPQLMSCRPWPPGWRKQTLRGLQLVWWSSNLSTFQDHPVLHSVGLGWGPRSAFLNTFSDSDAGVGLDAENHWPVLSLWPYLD